MSVADVKIYCQFFPLFANFNVARHKKIFPWEKSLLSPRAYQIKLSIVEASNRLLTHRHNNMRIKSWENFTHCW
jgi:hypothetical protein